jgi:hypothetical protein
MRDPLNPSCLASGGASTTTKASRDAAIEDGRAWRGHDGSQSRRLFHFFALLLLSLAFSQGARAATCFNACFRPQLVGADIEDSRIRSIMRRCHDMCEEDAERRFSLSGRGEKLLNCLPAPLSQDEFRRVRSASPSFLAFANTFTWDVHNVLPDKVIKRVEAITQNLELEDVVLGGGVMIAPGETETVFIPGFFDGYPQMRVSTRIKAIYACPLE